MKRSLSLVLDRDDNISLTLETMEARDLDIFTSKNFNSSEEIREKYKDVIEPYLEQYKNYLQYKTHKRGRIVITELQDDLTVEECRVIYKKSLIIFDKITNNKNFVDILQDRDYIRSANNTSYKRIFTENYGIEIKFKICSSEKFKRVMGKWRNWVKDRNDFYELVREVLKEYDEIRTDIKYKEYNFPTLDAVYKEYLKEKAANKEKREAEKLETEKEIQEELEELAREEMAKNSEELPTRYPNGADEEGYLGDLENWNRTEVKPDEDNKDYVSVPNVVESYPEPVRFISGADEEDYPGDLERWEKDQVSTTELSEGITNGKTKTLSIGNH